MKRPELNRYLVRYHGDVEVEAKSLADAEEYAAEICGPEHCEAELIEGEPAEGE